MRLYKSLLVLRLSAVLLLLLSTSCSKRSGEPASDFSSGSSSSPSAATAPAPSSAFDTATITGTAPSILSSSAARVSSDSSKKFIRTADLQFKVKDAIHATYKLEEITTRHHGYVGSTNLESVVDNRTTVPISEDSSLSTIDYTMKNTMTLRVPDAELDTTLKEIAPLVDFLDHRIIHADDITLKLLSDKVASERLTKSSERLTSNIEKHGKKLGEVTNAEDALLSRQQSADEAQLDALELMDQVKYSTIQISIYERPSFRREVVPNEKGIEGYKPGLGPQLMEALRFGWSLLEGIFLIIARLWGVILFIVVVFYIFRKLIKPSKKKIEVTSTGVLKAETANEDE